MMCRPGNRTLDTIDLLHTIDLPPIVTLRTRPTIHNLTTRTPRSYIARTRAQSTRTLMGRVTTQDTSVRCPLVIVSATSLALNPLLLTTTEMQAAGATIPSLDTEMITDSTAVTPHAMDRGSSALLITSVSSMNTEGKSITAEE
ncbi:hypothetical protein PAXRUDRAFT_646094 [Paxillus rubicundulus Ve08.2h10]|uniref:Uncharacterized protein n=1 Tax=Paxillus rubicundulus Ve08.2h10 TaxID=930991 RepID=A0A0D0DJU0_9AGAM|nr:hypothetical protein PAXRUDRAFT_646094 [Paxillus rubicundulus Ve08.2h10]